MLFLSVLIFCIETQRLQDITSDTTYASALLGGLNVVFLILLGLMGLALMGALIERWDGILNIIDFKEPEVPL